MEILKFSTTEREQAIDITAVIRKVVERARMGEGICALFCPHTTAAIAINEGTDETLVSDLFSVLGKAVPDTDKFPYTHPTSSPAHIKAALIGPEKAIPISSGKLTLGTWQSVLLLEFDGPREREIHLTVIG